jgi:hypothetical protein
MMDEAFEHAQRTNLLLGGHDADWCEKHVKSRLVFAKLRGERLRAKQEKQEALREARWAEEAAMEADRDSTFFKVTLYGATGQNPLEKQPDEDGNYPHIQHSSNYFNDDDEETCYEMVSKWAQALGLEHTSELRLFLILEKSAGHIQQVFEYDKLDELRDFRYETVEDVVPGRCREIMSLFVQGLAWPEQLPPSPISQSPKQQSNSPSPSTTGPKEGGADQEPQSGEV